MRRNGVEGDVSGRIVDAIARRRAELEANPDGTTSARRHAGDALRWLISSFVGARVDENEYQSFSAVIRALARRWASHPQGLSGPDAQPAAFVGMEDFPDRSPLVGRSNPIAPPMEFGPVLDGGEVRGKVTFGRVYEGAPGCVHGGFLAAAFDEALGVACIFSGQPGMTGELTVRYERPTPAGRVLEIAARLDRCEGRRIYTSGEIRSEGNVTCRAQGLFIAIGAEKFEELKDRRDGVS